MRLDEPRHQRHAGAVDKPHARQRHRGARALDAGDAVAFDANVGDIGGRAPVPSRKAESHCERGCCQIIAPWIRPRARAPRHAGPSPFRAQVVAGAAKFNKSSNQQ